MRRQFDRACPGLLAPLRRPLAAAGRRAPTHAAALYDPGTVVAIDLTLARPGRSRTGSRTGRIRRRRLLADLDHATAPRRRRAAPVVTHAWSKSASRAVAAARFSELTEKAAFKLKFNKRRKRFLGLKKMTLNNMVQDPSMVHETLAYAAFRGAGRAGLAHRLRLRPRQRRRLRRLPRLETLDDVGLEAASAPSTTPSTSTRANGRRRLSRAEPATSKSTRATKANSEDLEALIAAVNYRSGTAWSARGRPGRRPERDDPDVGGREVHRPLGRLCRHTTRRRPNPANAPTTTTSTATLRASSRCSLGDRRDLGTAIAFDGPAA